MGDWKALLPGRVVVCAPASLPSFFVDDQFGACELCGARVRFRPHIPAVRSLVCLLCFFVHAEPGEMCEVSNETIDELGALAWPRGES